MEDPPRARGNCQCTLEVPLTVGLSQQLRLVMGQKQGSP
jgi:hypothetical protein